MDERDERAVAASRRSSIHRAARRITLAGLVAGVAALAGLLGWAAYTRATWQSGPGFLDPDRAGQSFLGRGLRLIVQHPDFGLGATIVGAIAAAGLALAVVIWRRQRWGLLVTGIGGALVIAAPWLARAYVQHVETVTASRRWAARSPYVAASTTFAIAATIFLALLAGAALVAFATAPPAAPGTPARPAP